MAVYDKIAERLRTERQLRGLSQQELARRLGVASNTVSRWETGTYRPRLDELERVADTLGLGVRDLIPSNAVGRSTAIERLMDMAEGLSEDDLAEIERFMQFRRSMAATTKK